MTAYKLTCKDLGADCPFEIISEHKEELTYMMGKHAKHWHSEKMAAMSAEDSANMPMMMEKATTEVEA